MATYYKNADCSRIDTIKGVRINWVPTVLEDGNDNLNAPDLIAVTNEILEVEVETRDAGNAYLSRSTFGAGNTATIVFSFYQAATTSTPQVLTMTGPLCVEFGNNAAWGELSMYRVRFRATTWSLA